LKSGGKKKRLEGIRKVEGQINLKTSMYWWVERGSRSSLGGKTKRGGGGRAKKCAMPEADRKECVREKLLQFCLSVITDRDKKMTLFICQTAFDEKIRVGGVKNGVRSYAMKGKITEEIFQSERWH